MISKRIAEKPSEWTESSASTSQKAAFPKRATVTNIIINTATGHPPPISTCTTVFTHDHALYLSQQKASQLLKFQMFGLTPQYGPPEMSLSRLIWQIIVPGEL